MKDLPIELVGAVVESVASTSDLLSLRSVNSTCHYLATPHIFRKIHIHNNIQSTQKCRSIVTSPSLASHIREVVYDHRDHEQFRLLPACAQGVCELEIAELEDALTETFYSLPHLRHLESVVVNFWPSFRSQCGAEIQEPPFWFTNRQITVLHALHHAMKSCSVRSLALNNVILMSSACYDFVSSVTNSSLRHFSMSVVANSELGAWSGSKALNGSLSSLLPAPSANLKSLVIRSPLGLYHSLSTHLKTSQYPALETLVLENIVFDPIPSVDGIEEFILCHKASLRRLELHSCSSYVSSVSNPVRRWATIWRRLEEELACLTKLVVSDPHGYALLDGLRGYVPYPALSDELVNEDEEVHMQFSERVNLRSILSQKHL